MFNSFSCLSQRYESPNVHLNCQSYLFISPSLSLSSAFSLLSCSLSFCLADLQTLACVGNGIANQAISECHQMCIRQTDREAEGQWEWERRKRERGEELKRQRTIFMPDLCTTTRRATTTTRAGSHNNKLSVHLQCDKV